MLRASPFGISKKASIQHRDDDMDIDGAIKYNKARDYDRYLVESIQAYVGAEDDGVWGRETCTKIAGWQIGQGLESDGKVGPSTLRALSDWSPMIALQTRRPSTPTIRAAYPDNAILIDVSYHQGAIEWSVVARAAQIDGVIIKATQQTFVDPRFRANFRLTGGEGIPRGCYHYARLVDKRSGKITDPIRQAEYFCQTVLGEGVPELPMWLDLESSTTKRMVEASSPRECVDWAEAFLARCDAIMQRPSGVYWSANIVKNIIGVDEAARLRDRPTWWAYYAKHVFPLRRRPEGQSPKQPEGFTCDIWQIAGDPSARLGSGCAPGVGGGKGNLDVNVYIRGDRTHYKTHLISP
jgi:GH25 family lysozyme M1 (1,4-beta-N-acetylmuramidase)